MTTPVLDCAGLGHRYGHRGPWGLREFVNVKTVRMTFEDAGGGTETE